MTSLHQNHEKFKFQISSFRRFGSTMGNAIFLVATDPVCQLLSIQHFQSTLLHQVRLLGKRIIEKELDLMEKSLRRLNVTAWWESNGTRLRTCSRYIPNEYIKEIQDGWNYQCLLDCLESGINIPGVNLFIIGLLIYVDKTHTDGKGRFCLEPVIALLTLLNSETRAQFVSQICLGYINDLDLSSTAHKTTSVRTADDKGRSCRNWHKQMDVILEPIPKRQQGLDQRETDVHLMKARIIIDHPEKKLQHEKVCTIVPYIVAVLGDGKSNDHVVGRFGSYAEGLSRICWQCDVKHHNLSKPYEWQHYDWNEALRLSRIASNPCVQEYHRHAARDALHAQSQYVVENAFRYTNLLVPSPFGLPGARLVDMLYVILEGLMKYLAISFFARLTPSVKKK
jgi:hypothetical protein